MVAIEECLRRLNVSDVERNAMLEAFRYSDGIAARRAAQASAGTSTQNPELESLETKSLLGYPPTSRTPCSRTVAGNFSKTNSINFTPDRPSPKGPPWRERVASATFLVVAQMLWRKCPGKNVVAKVWLWP